MLTRPPSLRAIAAFEAAARLGNFSRAAEELNLTHGAISHAVRSLEQRLRVELFARVGRSVTLTHEGANLAKRVRLSLSLLTDAMDRRPQLGRGRLSIGAEPGIANRLLAPRLAGFKALHPEVDLRLRRVASATALAGAEVDVVVSATSGVDVGLASRLIAHEHLWPVATPEIATQVSMLEACSAQLVESLEHPWTLWFSQVGRKQPLGAPAILADNDLAAIELSRFGLGNCLAPSQLVADDLHAGTLRRVGDVGAPARSSYQVAWNPMSARAQEIEVFVAWIADALAPLAHAAAGRAMGAPTTGDTGICGPRSRRPANAA